jgi:cytochrome c556
MTITPSRVATALLLVLAAACQRPAPEPATADRRQAITLPPEARDAVLTEMRTMLGSLNGIVTGLANQDSAAIHQAAALSGLANAADPALEELLPEQFLTWGVATHRQFDDLAAATTRGVAADTTLAQLGRITQLCVTCHATYRIALR